KLAPLWRYRALMGGFNNFKHEYIMIFQKDEKHLRKIEKLNKLEAVKDIIALKDYEEAKKEFDDYSSLLQTQIAKLNELKSKFNAFVTTTKSAWLDELINKTQQANLLNAEINTVSFQTKQQIISSPANGFVGKLLIHTIGSAVNSGDQLITIIPNNEKLIAKANVLNKDIGFLNLGQNVAIKVETFNFQKYGKIDGNLTHIANDSIKDEKLGEIYEIKVDLSKNSLLVDGQEKKIEPGMNITAEIKVGKRRVIELFIYPIIRYLDEGLSVR
nr:HlyD family efflux transporter periplasmic adaptor subunit [Campylobacter sp.]